jgi:hypothetical protein
MDFRAAARHLAEGLSSDMAMDPTSQDLDIPTQRRSQPDPQTDDQDPATPGGPSPYNGSEPFSEPVASDPEWLNPQDDSDHKHSPVPFTPGPDEDTTTIHNARRASYEAKTMRGRSA